MIDPSSRSSRALTADWMVVELDGVRRVLNRPYVELDARGTVTRIAEQFPAPPQRAPIVRDLGRVLVVPGFVNAHSHAFQRRIRGATGTRGADNPSSFWSWREAMYRAANDMDPDAFYRATRSCYREMLGAGITCVGEFHYVHHQQSGAPYDNPNELSLSVVRAAEEVGLRLVLLEVYYARAGHGKPPRPEQRRFCDASLDHYLGRVDALRRLTSSHDFRVGLAPHSVRAVSAEDLALLCGYASENDLVLHAHVSEQPLENEQCQDEHGKTPSQVFADAGAMQRSRRFTAVHAIHVTAEDRALLGTQCVCACPTTEADLGDGIVPATELSAAGATICVGSDSNAVIDLVQEARLLEIGERLRRQERLCLPDQSGRVATRLLDAATQSGATSLGCTGPGRLAVGSPFDAACVDLSHPILEPVEPTLALDALMLSGSSAPIRQVYVGGEQRV